MNVEVNIGHDLYGIGKALQAIPNTINAISNAPKNYAQAGEIFVNTVGKIPEVVDKFSKTFEEHVDRNNERRIKQIRQANLSDHLSEKDKEQLRENAKQIIERNGGHLEEMNDGELFRLRKINELLNGKVENGGIRNQVANAVNGIKDVELKQNVFMHNDNAHFQRLFQNHEGRITGLEKTVDDHGKILTNHENRIGKLENTVDLHSKQLANHENRIGKLEGQVAQHGRILANHEGRIGNLENKVSQHSEQIAQLGNIVNVHTQQINELNIRVSENTKNISILNERKIKSKKMLSI